MRLMADRADRLPDTHGRELHGRELHGQELLTEREQRVLQGVFEGLGNKEIGAGLGVSVSAVKATLQQLFHKTGVRTRSQLVRIALERNLARAPVRRSGPDDAVRRPAGQRIADMWPTDASTV
jgi:DNA-binding NarL/FixJ family response regulator